MMNIMIKLSCETCQEPISFNSTEFRLCFECRRDEERESLLDCQLFFYGSLNGSLGELDHSEKLIVLDYINDNNKLLLEY